MSCLRSCFDFYLKYVWFQFEICLILFIWDVFDFTHQFKPVDSKHETWLFSVSFVYFLHALFLDTFPCFWCYLYVVTLLDIAGAWFFLDLARVQNHQYITHWDLPTECLQQEISSRLLLLVGSGGSHIWWSDIYNAVDARTGTNFFKEYLLCLLGSKAVIYVTHQVEFLPVADFMLVIKDVIFCSE